MGKIPDDATHWDGGDWIEYHRAPTGIVHNPYEATAHDAMARLTALRVNLLRAAKGYFELTGHHLPVYKQIAHVHAAIYCDLPLEGPDRRYDETGVEIMYLPPHSGDEAVEIDLQKHFGTLIVVRINDDFTSEARMVPRAALPSNFDGPYKMRWQALPHKM